MTAVETEHKGWLGRSVKRKEDARFIVGRGNYIEDIKLPGMLYMAILRSPYAHAEINSIDTSRAMELPGVVVVVTGDILAENPDPSEEEIRWAISGNICRCTGYQNIVKSVQYAAAKLKEAS